MADGQSVEQGGGAEAPGGAERRQGGDRRSGIDRRSGDRRTGSSFGGVGEKKATFLDHPGWIVATVVLGILIGIAIMRFTSTPIAAPVTRAPAAKAKPATSGMDVIVRPDSNTSD